MLGSGLCGGVEGLWATGSRYGFSWSLINRGLPMTCPPSTQIDALLVLCCGFLVFSVFVLVLGWTAYLDAYSPVAYFLALRSQLHERKPTLLPQFLAFGSVDSFKSFSANRTPVITDSANAIIASMRNRK